MRKVANFEERSVPRRGEVKRFRGGVEKQVRLDGVGVDGWVL